MLLRVITVLLLATLPAFPQRGGSNVTLKHIHVNSADPDKTVAFWTDILGLSTWSHDSLKGVSTLGVLILIASGAPSGPSSGSAIDHIGFKVPDLQPFISKLANTSYKTTQPSGDQLMIEGPDGIRIELVEDSSMYAPLQFDRIYLGTTRPADSQAWYAKVFGARPGGDDQPNVSFIGGAAFSFAPAGFVSPTAGRAIDHIAFEIKNLDSFCKRLTADGIKFDSPYQVHRELNTSVAFLTDPSGVRIELTEGLAH